MVRIQNFQVNARNYCSRMFDHHINGPLTSANVGATFLIRAAGLELLLCLCLNEG